MALPQDLGRQLKQLVGPDCYLDSPADTSSYGFNSYPAYTEPAAVVLFEDKTQIERVVPLLYERGIPMVIRGSGTNISGSALAPTGGVVLSLERMTRILEIDPVSRYMRVEAGANVKAIQQMADQHGLLFPPNPGNVDAITVGGIIGCNSSGDLALGYGTTRDFVLGLGVVLGDGQVLKLGSNVRKDVTGYDLIRIMVGAEGTLGVVVEATLRLVDRPEAEASVLAVFPDQFAGAAVALKLLALNLAPVALEYMDEKTTYEVEQAFKLGFPASAKSTLLVKFHGNRDSVNLNAKRCAELFEAEHATWTRQALAGESSAELWRARHYAYLALARICPTLYGEDIVVPPSQFPLAVERVHALAREIGLPIAVYAHAGDGHLHPVLLTDDGDPLQRAKSDRFVEGVIKMAIELGGTITGEHGLGVHKTRYIHLQYGDGEQALMHRVKQAFDPKGLFNPMICPVTGHAATPLRRKGVELL